MYCNFYFQVFKDFQGCILIFMEKLWKLDCQTDHGTWKENAKHMLEPRTICGVHVKAWQVGALEKAI